MMIVVMMTMMMLMTNGDDDDDGGDDDDDDGDGDDDDDCSQYGPTDRSLRPLFIRRMTTLSLTAADKKLAARALRRFRADHGCDFVDPENEDHINIYMSIKATNGRCKSNEFVKKYKAWVESSQKQGRMGAGYELTYWGVPTRNFPKGLPASLEQFEVSAEDLSHAQVMGGGDANVDTTEQFVLDQAAPRESLGKNVRTLRFWLETSYTLKKKNNKTENKPLPLSRSSSSRMLDGVSDGPPSPASVPAPAAAIMDDPDASGS